ncbi:MAG: hypothetical protein ABI193_07360 [Minicystis sp.]
MRRQKVLGFTALTAFALLLGGFASAQAQNTPPAQDPIAGQQARQVSLSPQEEVVQADGFIGRMEGARTAVQRQLETARAQRDVVKTLCLSDKLNQIDVAIRSARERKQSLDAAATRKDADLATHEFTILSVLRQRTDQLTAEANQCIGQEAAFIGESAVSSTIDPNIPQDPSEYLDTSVVVVIEPPSCVSCTF